MINDTQQYSERFKECVDQVLHHEGGYVNDPHDAGGETKYGISKRAFPHLDIKKLTRNDAILIYWKLYWQPIHGDQIVSNELALQVFDMAVNAGTGAAAKILQAIVGAHQDGAIGPLTLKAVDRYPSIAALIERYKFERAKFYCRIVSSNHSQARFLMGWINRIES
jgi:lysozyme family protein